MYFAIYMNDDGETNIHFFDNPGEIIDMMPATDRLLRHPNVQPPPEVFIPEEMRTLEGLIPIETTVPDYNLCIHIPPFYQIIYGIVADAGEILFESIFSALTFQGLSSKILQRGDKFLLSFPIASSK